MSYCRFAWGGSDVYVFESEHGLECCGCRLAKGGFWCDEPEEMIAHLGEHRRGGDYVPEHAILALWEDIPGAQRPREAEPASLTRSRLEMDIAVLQSRLDKLTDDADNPTA